MKKLYVAMAILAMAAVSAKAQTVFERESSSTYKITESTSLGGSIKMTENIVVGYNSGNVSGKIVFNPKNKSIKLSDKKLIYDPAKLKVQLFEHFRLTTGKARTSNQEGEATFQLIEDLEKESINLLIQWPDMSAVKVSAVLSD